MKVILMENKQQKFKTILVDGYGTVPKNIKDSVKELEDFLNNGYEIYNQNSIGVSILFILKKIYS